MLPQKDSGTVENTNVGPSSNNSRPNGNAQTPSDVKLMDNEQLLELLQKEANSDPVNAPLSLDPNGASSVPLASPSALYNMSVIESPSDLQTPLVITPGSSIDTSNSNSQLAQYGSSAFPYATNTYTLSKYNPKVSDSSVTGTNNNVNTNSSNSSASFIPNNNNNNNNSNFNKKYKNNNNNSSIQNYYDTSNLDDNHAPLFTEINDDYNNDNKTDVQHIQTKSHLAFKKPKPKKLTNAPSVPSKRPAFVMKLWNMVNDESNFQYICWLPKGDAFQVLDREAFMKHVLPKYFKHNNFASFVRQLNMYGWHKIQDVSSGSLLQGEEIWQFENPNFQKGREELLDNIIRNKSSKDADDDEVDLVSIMSELEMMRKNQQLIADDLRRVRQDNEMLWKENFMARERHKSQSNTLDKILRFLATVYGGNSSKFLENVNGSNEVFDLVSQRYNDSMNLPLQQAGNDNLNNSGNTGNINNSNNVGNINNSNNNNGQPSDLYEYPYQTVSTQPYGVPKQPLLISNREHYRSPTSSLNSVNVSNNDGGFIVQQVDSSPSNLNTNGSLSNLHESPIQEIPRGPENRNVTQFDNFPNQQNHQQFRNETDSPRAYFPELVKVGSYEPPLTPNSELLMGTINSQLNKQQGTIKQVNEWITKFANGKSSDDVTNSDAATNTVSGSQYGTGLDDFRVDDFLNAQTPDFTSSNASSIVDLGKVNTNNSNSGSINSGKVTELYQDILRDAQTARVSEVKRGYEASNDDESASKRARY